MAWMRLRVSSLTIGLPRRARDTVGWETPARCAISSEVALPLIVMAPWSQKYPAQAWRAAQRGRSVAAVPSPAGDVFAESAVVRGNGIGMRRAREQFGQCRRHFQGASDQGLDHAFELGRMRGRRDRPI